MEEKEELNFNKNIEPFKTINNINKSLSYNYNRAVEVEMFNKNPFVKLKKYIMNWYYAPEIKYNICSYTYKREIALIVPEYFKQYVNKDFSGIRKLKIHSLKNFDGVLKITGFNRLTNFFNNEKYNDLYKIYNLYYSMASFKEGVPFRYDVDEEYLDDWYSNKYFNEMNGFDFFIDIDCKEEKDFKYASYSVLNISELFNKLNIPYEIRFSGYGFHIVIPYDFIKINFSFNPKDDNNIYKIFSSLAKKISKEYSDMIDKELYDSKRVLKIPYSLSIYDFDEVYVCFPIHEINDIKNFNINNYKPENINILELRNRRSFIFNQFNSNFNNLLKYYNLKNE